MPTFSEPHRLSIGALSQQLPLRLIELRMPYSVSARWKSSLQYWLPRSLWKITPGSGLRRNQAMRRASMTNSRFMCGFIDQPTTWRLNRSMTTARYSQPSSVVT